MTTLAHKHFDNVKQTTNTVGLIDRVLGAAALGYTTLAAAGAADGDVVPLTIRSVAGEYETGLYRYNSAAVSVTPLEIVSSSNAGAVVNFSAGSKDVICGPIARHILDPAPAWPFSTAQTVLRVNLLRSALTFTNRGYISQITDISGNGRHSAVNVTNGPKYVQRGMNGLPGAFFNGAHRWTFPTTPVLPAPLGCCIIGIGSDWGAPSGNSHIYNYAGNPIGFSATTSLEFIYNGTLPAAHSDAQAIVQENRPDGLLGYPVAFLHVYNGAASINGVNGVEQVASVNPGTIATGAGATGFVIGADSSAGNGAQFNRMVLTELAVLNFVPTATQRLQLWAYMRAMGRLAFV